METLNNLTTNFTPPSNPKPLLHRHPFHPSPLLLHHRHHPSPPPPPPPPPRPLKHPHLTPLSSKPHLKSPKYPPPPSSPKSPKYPSSPPSHHRPASGYAAAILDIAMRDGTLGTVIRDMERLGRVLRRKEMKEFMEDDGIGVREKGEVVKGVVRGMGVGEMVCGLVELLVGKGRGGVVVLGEVVGEFVRILGELTGMRRRGLVIG